MPTPDGGVHVPFLHVHVASGALEGHDPSVTGPAAPVPPALATIDPPPPRDVATCGPTGSGVTVTTATRGCA
jgi:hypothetical protein